MMNWNLPLYLMLYLEKSNNSKTCPTVPARIVQISNVLKSSGSILGAATPDSAHFYCGAGGGGACACAGAGGNCRSRESRSCRLRAESARCCQKSSQQSLRYLCASILPSGRLHRSDPL